MLYSNRTFITCRSPGDSFFLCQVLQDVYNDTKRFRIRWCARTDGKDDEAPIDENTHFQMDYDDTLDPQTILTGIPDVIRHSDKTLSLSKQHIFETKRLLDKSIKGETSTSTSDEPMDLTADSTTKAITKPARESSDDDSLAIRRTPPPPLPPPPPQPSQTTPAKIKKRKMPSDSPRKQPPKKRVRKESGETVRKYLIEYFSSYWDFLFYLSCSKTTNNKRCSRGIRGRKREEKGQTTNKENRFVITSIEFMDIPSLSLAPKPATTPKAQLFKVQSNRLLKENLLVTAYRKDPFFEDE